MFAYYTAARWFGLVIDLILLIFLTTVVIIVFEAIRHSSTTAGWNHDNIFYLHGPIYMVTAPCNEHFNDSSALIDRYHIQR